MSLLSPPSSFPSFPFPWPVVSPFQSPVVQTPDHPGLATTIPGLAATIPGLAGQERPPTRFRLWHQVRSDLPSKCQAPGPPVWRESQVQAKAPPGGGERRGDRVAWPPLNPLSSKPVEAGTVAQHRMLRARRCPFRHTLCSQGLGPGGRAHGGASRPGARAWCPAVAPVPFAPFEVLMGLAMPSPPRMLGRLGGQWAW